MVIYKKVLLYICIFSVGLTCLAYPARAENENAVSGQMQWRLTAREVDNELVILNKQIKELENQKKKLLKELRVPYQKRQELELRAMFALRPLIITGTGKSLSDMKEKVRSLQQKLDSKQERLVWLKRLNYPTLTIKAKPAHAKIKILNIKPAYHAGIVLNPGRYLVEVSARGYVTEKRWVKLAPGMDKELVIILDMKPFTETVTGMEFVFVPAGCFDMGCGNWTSNCSDDEKPVHTVCVDDFYIGRYEVTQGQWKKVMHSNPSEFQKGDNYPVENVSWNDVEEFIKKLNSRSNKRFRLPTEAEWEYAARSGGRKEKYVGGDDVDRVAWYGSNSSDHTHPVGTKAPNGLGIYDMSGNVWEWCQDWYCEDYYSKSPRNNPHGPSSGSLRVLRGGSWCNGPWFVRSALRVRLRPASRSCDLGFRLALPIDQASR